MAMTVAGLREAVGSLAPEALAEEWDNVGLLVGRADRSVDRVLIALDLRAQTVEEAVGRGAQAIVTHHPPIFPSAAAVTDVEPSTARVLEAAEAGIAVIAAHTNLDAAPGGLNDIMAAALGMTDARPLVPAELDGAGLGRVGRVAPTTLGAIAEVARQAFGAALARRTGDADSTVETVACCTGSGAGLIDAARKAGVDAYITGDLKYHDADRAGDLPLVDLPHADVEGHAMRVWSEGLAAALTSSGVAVGFTERGSDPWTALAPI